MIRTVKIILLILFAGFISLLYSNKAQAAEAVYEDNENGIITISYNNTENVKMKISVSKDAEYYYYDLKDGENEIDIPLNMGNGTYKIRICKNLTGSKYSIIESTSIELDLTDEDEVFLHSNVIVQFASSDSVIEKAEALTKDCNTDTEKITKVYDFIVENFTYDYDKLDSLQTGYVPDIKIVYKNKKGICYDMSAVLAAMLRSQGIKVKLVTGYTPNVEEYHAWNAVYDSKKEKWYTIDTTYDIVMNQAGKKYKMKKEKEDYEDVKYQY